MRKKVALSKKAGEEWVWPQLWKLAPTKKLTKPTPGFFTGSTHPPVAFDPAWGGVFDNRWLSEVNPSGIG